nr:hypothetical protein [Streptococcus oralis]
VFIPSAADRYELREKVQQHGLYHKIRLAVQPNGSISYINDLSASIQPIKQPLSLINKRRCRRRLMCIYRWSPYQ